MRPWFAASFTSAASTVASVCRFQGSGSQMSRKRTSFAFCRMKLRRASTSSPIRVAKVCVGLPQHPPW